ncbi:hypothetical protein AN639_12960 [Candidatus Epulonipiscium fishelsonii]|uniref:Uncharacterized protein n=1 Tax=Candidatus Epulonipiscium fishelsonii TaxID=77094 RepID=A0ACC8X8Q0_9FIRM|nr:hypothetical protein AN396_10705 [Epulopiscium sp. SCG-B11WGA-EpuloA1]ONI42122.1 hypothetical protein AN639_12960 [Epulopiscium sp. SCG-B05WGA-EpuloA1]
MEIMEYFWNNTVPKNFSAILNYFNTYKNKNWKKQTLSTYLTRLVRENLLKVKPVGTNTQYSYLISQEEYESMQARGLLNKQYDGSLKNFLIALYQGKPTNCQEIEELQSWLSKINLSVNEEPH